ncbi:hypothetical protein Tco_1227909 [Tanacetum coccineum]
MSWSGDLTVPINVSESHRAHPNFIEYASGTKVLIDHSTSSKQHLKRDCRVANFTWSPTHLVMALRSVLEAAAYLIVAVSGVPVDRSHVHTHDHDGSEAPDELPDSILLNEAQAPPRKIRPPPPPSIGHTSPVYPAHGAQQVLRP